MNLADFEPGIVPSIVYGRTVDTAPMRGWLRQGLITPPAGEPRPSYLDDLWRLTDRGRRVVTGIDESRWPYLCGRLDRADGRARNWHETNYGKGLEPGSGSHRHWVAGWDSVGRV